MKLVIAGTVLLFSIFSWANPTEIRKLEQTLKSRAIELLEPIDAKAIVQVKVKAKTLESKLPALPYVIKDIVLRGPAGSMQLESVDYRITSYMQNLPEEIVESIKDLTSDFNVEPKLVLIQPHKTKLNIAQIVNRLLQPEILLLASAVILVCLLVMVAILLRIYGQSRLHNIIRTSTANITKSLENSPQKNTPTSGPSIEALEPLGQNLQSRDNENGTQNEKIIQSLELNSLLALLWDCYWCEEDGYAAYLWSLSTLEQRNRLINSSDTMKKYCKYASRLRHVALSFHSDPYYLKPLSLNHLNNESLCEQVEPNPSFYHALPSIRAGRLQLNIRHRISILQLDDGDNKNWDSILVKLPPSPARQLKYRTKVRPTTIDEEGELVKMEDLELEQMEDIISLVWALKLPIENLAKILHRYSAIDLAQVWIGAPPILDHLKAALPDAKLQILLEYLSKTEASRANPLYEELHGQVISELSILCAENGLTSGPNQNSRDAA